LSHDRENTQRPYPTKEMYLFKRTTYLNEKRSTKETHTSKLVNETVAAKFFRGQGRFPFVFRLSSLVTMVERLFCEVQHTATHCNILQHLKAPLATPRELG